MNEEMKRMFDELRAELGKNVAAVAKIDGIAQRLEAGELAVKAAKDEIKVVRELAEEQKRQIEDIRKQTRVEGMARDGVADRRSGLILLGAQLRQRLAAHLGARLDSRFAGEAKLIEEFQARALNPNATTGSYLVPTITEMEIMDTVEEVSDLISRTDFQPGLPGKMALPTLLTRPTLQHVRATNDTAQTASAPTFGTLPFSPEEGYVFFPVDNRLLEMAAANLGQYCLNLTRDAIIQGLATDLLSGDGTTDFNSFTGILKEATAGYIYSLTGATAFSGLTKAHLSAIKAKADKRGRARGVWLMSEYIKGIVEDLDRTGKVPVITYRASDGMPLLLGNPIVVDEGMPDLADSAVSTACIGFGDLATYLVGLVGGIQLAVSSEVYFNKNQTCFRGTINYALVRKPRPSFITGKTAAE